MFVYDAKKFFCVSTPILEQEFPRVLAIRRPILEIRLVKLRLWIATDDLQSFLINDSSTGGTNVEWLLPFSGYRLHFIARTVARIEAFDVRLIPANAGEETVVIDRYSSCIYLLFHDRVIIANSALFCQ